MKIKILVLSPFGVNTHIIYDETNECVIIDPACYSDVERKKLENFIVSNNLKPVRLLNTHCHLDHVFGNNFVCDTFSIGAESSKEDEFILNSAQRTAAMYGLKMQQPYPVKNFINENDIIKFGNSEIKILHIPGHSPGSLVYYSEKDLFAIVGDVLFAKSIGRTDLPGGNFETLISNIKNKLFKLNDETVVYPGHGEKTKIGIEKKTNPFLQ